MGQMNSVKGSLKSKGAMRYLCHLDDPQKAQYSQVDVQCIGGLDYSKITTTDEDENKQTNGQIAKILNINDGK